MTKKDFVLIASALRASCPRLSCPWGGDDGERMAWTDGAMETWCNTVIVMTNALAKTNPRFNRDTFSKACCPEGVEI